MQLTRRKLAAALLAPAAAAQAQTAPPADELQAARDRIRTNSQILAKVEIAMTVEPAFEFEA